MRTATRAVPYLPANCVAEGRRHPRPGHAAGIGCDASDHHHSNCFRRCCRSEVRDCRDTCATGRQRHGLTNLNTDLIAKWLELLKQAVPRLATVAFLWDPISARTRTKNTLSQAVAAAPACGFTRRGETAGGVRQSVLDNQSTRGCSDRVGQRDVHKGANAPRRTSGKEPPASNLPFPLVCRRRWPDVLCPQRR
jgi:hypothetical protein